MMLVHSSSTTIQDVLPHKTLQRWPESLSMSNPKSILQHNSSPFFSTALISNFNGSFMNMLILCLSIKRAGHLVLNTWLGLIYSNFGPASCWAGPRGDGRSEEVARRPHLTFATFPYFNSDIVHLSPLLVIFCSAQSCYIRFLLAAKETRASRTHYPILNACIFISTIEFLPLPWVGLYTWTALI